MTQFQNKLTLNLKGFVRSVIINLNIVLTKGEKKSNIQIFEDILAIVEEFFCVILPDRSVFFSLTF